jgi:mono/diheme cytochrome c family protein
MSSSFDLRILGAGLAMAFVLAPQSGWSADAGNGSRLAHRWCEACHIVAPTQRRVGSDMAPPFATIAKRPDFNASQVALFLLNPHPKMPDMSLSRTEAADIAAYIASLAH